MSIYLVVDPVRGPLNGFIPVPPEANPVALAVILGGLAEGPTQIHTQGIVQSPAVDDTVRVLDQLGVKVTPSPRGYRVQGHGGFERPRSLPVEGGRALWTLPLLVGLASKVPASQVSFEPLPPLPAASRPSAMQLLDRLGLDYTLESGDRALTVRPQALRGGTWEVPPELSEWLVPLLLIAPLAKSPVTLVGHPEAVTPKVWEVAQLLRAFGIFFDQDDAEGWWQIPAPQGYRAAEISVGPDTLQAAFSLLLGALHAGDLEWTQLGAVEKDLVLKPLIDILRQMGVPLEATTDGLRLSQVHRQLHGGTFDLAAVPRLLPLLAVAATMASGTTAFEGVPASVLAEPSVRAFRETLTWMGAEIAVTPTGWMVEGGGRLQGSLAATPHDPVEFLALVLAGTVTEHPVSITPAWEYLGHTPHFFDVLGRIGIGTSLRAVHVNIADAG